MFFESHSDFGPRGFQGNSYGSQARGVPERGYHRAHNFVCPGVERNGGAVGFAYGSDVNYSRSDQELQRRARLASETSLNELKLKKQQKDAERHIKEHHEARLKLRQENISEKKRDFEQLQTYKPWGRPAPGAPRFTKSGALDMRKKRLELEVDSIQHSPSEEYQPFGRPGAGAPRRTTSGELSTQIQASPTIRFQDHLKKEVQHSLRYRNPGGSRQEETDGGGERVHRTESEKEKLINEKERKLKYGQRLEEQRIEMLERKAVEKAEEKALPNAAYPWGKNKVDRDESGKVQRRKWQLGRESDYSQNSNGMAFQLGQPGAGAPLRDSAGRVKTRRYQPETKRQLSSEFDPWGRPGAGAPIKDKEGEIVTAICGKFEKEGPQDNQKLSKRNPVTGEINTVTTISKTKRGDSQASNRQYFTELQLQAEHRQQELKQNKELERKLEQEHAQHTGYMWEDKRSRRAQPFVRTGWETKDDKDEAKKKEYYEELQSMVNQQNILREQSREKAIQKEREHVAAYVGQWGRPGGGAPRRTTQGELDVVSPRNLGSMLGTQTHTGAKFRRT